MEIRVKLMENIRFICILLTICCLLGITGCDNESVPSSKVEQQRIIKALETQAGFVLPSVAELTCALDRGVRDSSYEAYLWGVYSPSSITTMPKMKKPYTKDYQERSLDTVEFVQDYMGKRKIKNPQTVFSSNWEMGYYDFRGTVVRTPQGDYMIIQRFRMR